MKSYDLPGDTSFMGPEEARQAVNRLRADILADPSHPFNDGNHPQHGDFAGHFGQLHSIIQQGEADAQAEAAARELEDALGEDAGLSPAECLDRAKILMRTPGYITGALPSRESERLTRKIHALYEVSRQETSTPSDQEDDE